jgi:hypothetical protein
VIDYFRAAQISARLARGVANFIFVAKDCDSCQALSRRAACRNHSPRVITFGQNDVLWIGGSALANLIKNGHGSGQLSVVSGQLLCESDANLS